MENNSNKLDFIKCGSPLGEYELHCDKDTKQQILENKRIAEAVKFAGKSEEEYVKKVADNQEIVKDCKKVLELWRLGFINDGDDVYMRFKSILERQT